MVFLGAQLWNYVLKNMRCTLTAHVGELFQQCYHAGADALAAVALVYVAGRSQLVDGRQFLVVADTIPTCFTRGVFERVIITFKSNNYS